ncbi:MAG: DUF2948 family protein [Pseudomonadota bacterium]
MTDETTPTPPDASMVDALREAGGLKLRATDAEDLAALSALLQDALVPAGDLRPDPGNKRFLGVLNRYRWETPKRERGLCALRIDQVLRVRTRGFDPADPEQLLSLLAIRTAEPDGAPAALELTFSAGAAVRLEVEAIAVFAEDLSEAYPTLFKPRHADEA